MRSSTNLKNEKLLPRKRIGQDPPYSRLDGTARYPVALIGFLITLLILFLAWAITTTVIMSKRVDPIGHFQCGSTLATDGDLCFDFVQVGCGSAGIATARRLSDDFTQTVLCIEEGPDYAAWNSQILDIPSGLFDYTLNPVNYPKFYYEIPGKGEPGLLLGQHIYTSGRTFGGGSSENFMVMMRGDDTYWDNFDAAVGSPGTFCASAIQTEFENIEWLNDWGHYASTATRGNGQRPGQTVKIDTLPHNSAIGFDQEAMANLLGAAWGIPVYSDQSYNAPGITTGAFMYTELLMNFNTSNPEQRWTSRAAFADASVMNQETYTGVYPRRLSVFLNSTIFKLLQTAPSQFKGVSFKDRDGNIRRAYARKEVVLSAGINSAPLLQRSGIGPSAVLQQAGITPLLVNENIGTRMGTDIEVAFLALWPNVTGIRPDGADNTAENVATALTEDPTPPGVPGQRAFVNLMATLAPGFVFLGMDKYNSANIGEAIVASSDPFQVPTFVSNQMTDPNDLTSLRTAIRNLIWGAVAADLNFFPINIDNATLADDGALDDWIRANGVLPNHYENQCLMGTNASASVIDNRFRVWGAQGLRVCDVQSFATKLAMHPSLPAMMIGNLCGRLILEDHGLLAPPPSAKKKTVRKTLPLPKKKHVQSPPLHNPKKRDDASLWASYLSSIDTIREKFSPQRAKQLIASIMRTTEFIRLCTIYSDQCLQIQQ